ncbi:hypothetical protein HYV50_04270 [Candidatus Pacearchaeota archaeon]|nr:hypothetical protein [Candidatus Pacearchaeota archaeon]
MAKGKSGNKLGSWAFLIGVILAVLFGIFGGLSDNPQIAWLVLVIGIVVGLMNVADEEVEPFLMAGTVLVIVSVLGQNALGAVPFFVNILQALSVLFVPATIIVALKHVFAIAKN